MTRNILLHLFTFLFLAFALVLQIVMPCSHCQLVDNPSALLKEAMDKIVRRCSSDKIAISYQISDITQQCVGDKLFAKGNLAIKMRAISDRFIWDLLSKLSPAVVLIPRSLAFYKVDSYPSPVIVCSYNAEWLISL